MIFRNKKGQGLAEYALIIAIVVVGLLFARGAMNNQLSTSLSRAGSKVVSGVGAA